MNRERVEKIRKTKIVENVATKFSWWKVAVKYFNYIYDVREIYVIVSMTSSLLARKAHSILLSKIIAYNGADSAEFMVAVTAYQLAIITNSLLTKTTFPCVGDTCSASTVLLG